MDSQTFEDEKERQSARHWKGPGSSSQQALPVLSRAPAIRFAAVSSSSPGEWMTEEVISCMLHMHKFVYRVTQRSTKADAASTKCKNSSLYMSHGAFGIASLWFGGWVMFGKPDTWVTSQPPRYNERGRRFDIISRSHEKLRLRLKDCMTHQPEI